MNAPTAVSHLVPEVRQREVPPALIDALKGRFGDRCSTAMAVREQHGRDESSFVAPPPAAVVFAESTQDIADAVRLCSDHETPVIPFGVGTSLEGHLLAVQGGISIDVGRMNKVLSVNPEDLTVTVQAGVTRKQLNEEIRSTGLFFPIDPGADATLGGMSATRASGTNAVRYGTMRENVLALEVVTASGDVIRTGTRAKKSSAGYDLTRLFVGAEGTLGIITEVTVRLYAVPEAMSAAVCSFADLGGAVATVIQTLQAGIPIARCEALCATTMKAINAYSKTSYPEQPALFLEFHGTEAGVREQSELVQEIAREHGGQGFEWATRAEDRTRLWAARHMAYFAGLQLMPGARAVSTDVCVPISRLTECMAETAGDIARASMPIPMFGHVGDGNFHCMILISPDDPKALSEAKAFNDRLVDRALAMEGTCTGEHGIGSGKIKSLQKEHGDAVDLMVALKRTFDPDNLMNPGKVVPLEA
jgi:D-lactate dehydrogenase (cytochrome)